MLTKDLPVARKPYDWELAKRLYFQGMTPTDIANQLGIKSESLMVRLTKAGLPKQRREAANAAGERLSLQTKAKLARVADQLADRLLAKVPASQDGMNQYADTGLKAARIGALVHGWNESSTTALIVPGLFAGFPSDDLEPEREAIDVGSNLAVEAEDEPEGQ